MADVSKILRAYGRLLQKNVRLKTLAERASSYNDAREFVNEAARVLTDVLKMYMDPTAITQDEAVQILSATMKQNYSNITRICARAQRKMYADAGVGLNAITPEFNAEKVRSLATVIMDTENITDDYVRGLITNNALGVVDETMRINAEACENVGLAVHIKRTYDDVGLHDGKDVCKWCMDRVGEWDNYQEAYNAGVFQRHPGCGCMIEYHVGKTHTWQRRAGGWNEF